MRPHQSAQQDKIVPKQTPYSRASIGLQLFQVVVLAAGTAADSANALEHAGDAPTEPNYCEYGMEAGELRG